LPFWTLTELTLCLSFLSLSLSVSLSAPEGIRMKEECIRAITREQQSAASRADLFQDRVSELERERSSLSAQLQEERKRAEEEQVEEQAYEPEGASAREEREAQVQSVHKKYQEKLRKVQVSTCDRPVLSAQRSLIDSTHMLGGDLSVLACFLSSH
jgi:hypothetical protein